MKQLITNINWPLLEEKGIIDKHDSHEIKKLLKTTDPLAIFSRMRRFLETLLGHLFFVYKEKKGVRLNEMIEELKELFPQMIVDYLHSLRRACNNAAHASGSISRDYVRVITPMFVYVIKHLLLTNIKETLINCPKSLLNNSNSINLSSEYLNSKLTEQQKAMDGIKDENKKLEEKLKAWAEKINQLENEKEKYHLKLSGKNLQVKQLIEEIAELETKINRKSLEIQMKSKEIEDLTKTKKNLEIDKKKLMDIQNKENIQNIPKSAQIAYNLLEKKYQKKKFELEKTERMQKSEVNKLMQMKNELENRVLKQDSMIERLTNELGDMQDKNDALIEQYKNLLEDPVENISELYDSNEEYEQIYLEWFLLGEKYFDMDIFEKAIESWERCLEINPKQYSVNYLLGLVHFMNSNNEKAVEYWQFCLEQKQNDPHLFENLGELYYEEEEYSTSEHYLMQSLQINPKNSNVSFILGQINEQSDNKLEALEYYKKVDIEDPNYEIAERCIETINVQLRNSQRTNNTINSKNILAIMKSFRWYSLKELRTDLQINDLKDARFLQLKLKQLTRNQKLKFEIRNGKNSWKKVQHVQ